MATSWDLYEAAGAVASLGAATAVQYAQMQRAQGVIGYAGGKPIYAIQGGAEEPNYEYKLFPSQSAARRAAFRDAGIGKNGERTQQAPRELHQGSQPSFYSGQRKGGRV